MQKTSSFSLHRFQQNKDAIPFLFFISGFAALIYQVIWQRTLFSTFGINIESVTVVVSVFMFGLGIGAIAGGAFQARYPAHCLKAFVVIETLIGLFGLVSIPLIHRIGYLVPGNSVPQLVFVVYALLALPTLLMGATLPLLVAQMQRSQPHRRRTVGRLYAFNTLGSCVSSCLTVTVLFHYIGLQATIDAACLFNLTTACLAVILLKPEADNADRSEETVPETALPPTMSYRTILAYSLAVGYIALSLEILWIRISGYLMATAAPSFGVVLSLFLCGIGMGSLAYERFDETRQTHDGFIRQSLFGLAVAALAALPLICLMEYGLSAANTDVAFMKPIVCLSLSLSIWIIGYYSGRIFPALCHQAVAARPQGEGTAAARVYFANIAGATAGTLLTGFYLLDRLPLNRIALSFGVIAALFWLFDTMRQVPRIDRPTVIKLFSLVACLVLSITAMPSVYERLNLKSPNEHFRYVSENRSGIITVFPDPGGDIVSGNGAYDGRYNLDPNLNSNLIARAYMIAALHPSPGRVLEIGLSSGSWAKVIASYRPVEKLKVIEINEGYLDLIGHYPEIATVLSDPKTEVTIDDGRRWLNHHPSEKFDLIVMNTSFYWRSNVTNLLSVEFLRLAKMHLNPGGTIYFNTTGQDDSVYTLAHVFGHVVKYMNFVAGSDRAFDRGGEARRRNLLSFIADDGKPVFQHPGNVGKLEELAHQPLEDLHDAMLNRHDLWLITDDNMATEFKIPIKN